MEKAIASLRDLIVFQSNCLILSATLSIDSNIELYSSQNFGWRTRKLVPVIFQWATAILKLNTIEEDNTIFNISVMSLGLRVSSWSFISFIYLYL
jgi:hypothetical protein